MNSGPHTVYNCPGRYSLQVAEFGGRSFFNPTPADPRLFGKEALTSSPLKTAGDNAERLADALAKATGRAADRVPALRLPRPDVEQGHGRRVQQPQHPKAAQLRETLLRIAVPLADRKKAGVIIAPANTLTDLEDPNRPIKTLK